MKILYIFYIRAADDGNHAREQILNVLGGKFCGNVWIFLHLAAADFNPSLWRATFQEKAMMPRRRGRKYLDLKEIKIHPATWRRWIYLAAATFDTLSLLLRQAERARSKSQRNIWTSLITSNFSRAYVTWIYVLEEWAKVNETFGHRW